MRGEGGVFMRPRKRKMSVTLDGDIIEIIKEHGNEVFVVEI